MKKFIFASNAILFFVIGLLFANIFSISLAYASTLILPSELTLEYLNSRIDDLEDAIDSLSGSSRGAAPSDIEAISDFRGHGYGHSTPDFIGPEGKSGINCWDLDMDRENDSNEDLNGDGRYDVYDCRVPISPPQSTPTPEATSTPNKSGSSVTVPTISVSKPALQDIGQVTNLWYEVSFVDTMSPNTQREEYVVSRGSSSLWGFLWCADTASRLQNNISSMRVDMWVNGNVVPSSNVLEYTFADGTCYAWMTHLTHWDSSGAVPLQVRYTFNDKVYDGENTYQSGDYYRILDVTIR